MIGDELLLRLRRINAAIAASVENDLSKVSPKVLTGNNFVEIYQDFSGDLSEEELSNLAHQVIHNVANLRDNLIRWADTNGKNAQRVWDTFNSSLEIRVIQDLSNNDKHGFPPKNGVGNSGIAPQVKEINRVMRLTANPGSDIVLMMGPTGLISKGSGSAVVVVTGQLIDKMGKIFGDLYEFQLTAVEAWEKLLAEFKILQN